MKILLLRDYNMYAETGASANRWRTLVEGLSKLDVEIILIITSGYKSKEEIKSYGKKGFINGNIQYIYSSDQKGYNIWLRRLNLYLLSGFYLLINVRRIRKIIKNTKPEIVFFISTLDAFRIVTKIFPQNHNGLKLMMEINEFNDIWDTHATNRLQKLLNQRYTYYLSRKIFPRLDLCLVMTETLRKYYSQFPDINPEISFLNVPMTVDLDRFKIIHSSLPLKRPYIAYCGSSSFHTDGVDIMIKSFARISDEHPELKLYIAAFWEIDGPRMLKLIQDLRLGDRIIYLGTLSRDEIPALIKNARVLALARPDSRQAQGAFPTKLGEYLASGNAVCVTRIGEIPHYLVENESAFLAEPGDVDSFADALKRALSDETNAKRVGENGRMVAELHFNMDVQAKRIYDFLLQSI